MDLDRIVHHRDPRLPSFIQNSGNSFHRRVAGHCRVHCDQHPLGRTLVGSCWRPYRQRPINTRPSVDGRCCSGRNNRIEHLHPTQPNSDPDCGRSVGTAHSVLTPSNIQLGYRGLLVRPIDYLRSYDADLHKSNARGRKGRVEQQVDRYSYKYSILCDGDGNYARSLFAISDVERTWPWCRLKR